MLGSRTERARGVAQHGCKFGSSNGAHVGTDFALERAVGGYTPEQDSFVIIGRVQGQRDRQAGMHADASDGDLIA